MGKVFFISAGQLRTKKGRNISNQKNMYLNYGLLSLATVVNNAGYQSLVIHGNFSLPDDFFSELVDLGLLKTNYPIYISIPSYYALSWVRELTNLLKDNVKNKIYIGGRWVIDSHPELLSKEIPYADEIISGVGENKILGTITGLADNNNYKHLPLDYSLLFNRELYQPSIEISRGCGMKCSFCQEKNEPLTSLKPPESIIKEFNKIILHDNLREMTPYFEASMFKPTQEWLDDFIFQREKYNQRFSWRTESRVDAFSERLIPLLAQAGMKVIDLGLESASPIQLSRMNKTKKPDTYLDKASKLLKICHDNNIKAKVNVMLYAGEDNNSLDETRNFLKDHKNYIYGLSCGVVSAFGWECEKKDFISYLVSHGAEISEEDSFLGVTNFHLSNKFSYSDSVDIAKELSKEFMSLKNFFDLKAFSYYPRDYLFEQFVKDVKSESGSYSFNY